jgi:hypothetical protein
MNSGVSVPQIRTAVTRLRDRGILMSGGRGVYECTPAEVLDLLFEWDGPRAFGMTNGELFCEVDRALSELSPERADSRQEGDEGDV